MSGIELRFFVLEPCGDSPTARAARAAMLTFADLMRDHDERLANQIVEWVKREANHVGHFIMPYEPDSNVRPPQGVSLESRASSRTSEPAADLFETPARRRITRSAPISDKMKKRMRAAFNRRMSNKSAWDWANNEGAALFAPYSGSIIYKIVKRARGCRRHERRTNGRSGVAVTVMK